MAPLFASDLAPPRAVRGAEFSFDLAPPAGSGCGSLRHAGPVPGCGECFRGLLITSGVCPFGWGRDGVEGGAVRRDPLGLPAGGAGGAGAGPQVRRAPPYGAPGDRLAVAAGPQEAGAAVLVREAVAGWIDEMLREDLARRASSGIPPGGSSSGCAMNMTRRCRIRPWPSTCSGAAPGSPPRRGLRTAARTGSCRRPRSRAPRPRWISVTCCRAGRSSGQVLPVRLPPVVRRQGLPPGVCVPGSGSLPGRARDRVRGHGRGAVAARPVRQLVPGGGQGADRPQPHRDRPWLSFRSWYKSVSASSRSSLAGELLLAVS